MKVNRLKLNISELVEYGQDKKFIVFGAGVQGIRAISYFNSWFSDNRVIGFIDNMKEKQNTKIQIEGNEYLIMSFDDALKIMEADTCIFIASLYHSSILKQIDETISEKVQDCIVLDEVAEKELYCGTYSEVVKEYDQPVIPRVLHYAWFGGKEPDFVKRNIENWHKLCPDYEIVKWGENNYDISKNKYMLQAYESKIWGFVPDYLRLDVIYQQGGIYLDTDVTVVRNLDDLLFQECFASVDATLTMNLGSGFGAKPNCEIIRELRDYYDDVNFIDENGIVDMTSCNSHSYKVLKKYGVQINNKLQNVRGMNIYPMIFQGACAHTRKEKITDKTYVVHYGEMSWLKEKLV